MNTDLKTDLDKFMKERLDPINKKMIEQEKLRHKQYLNRHFGKYDLLSERHDDYISQMISLESVIFGAIIIFTQPGQVTMWLILSVCLILVSLIFGIWSKNIKIQADYQGQEFNYYQEMKNHWWTRELWKDDSVKSEKELMKPHIEKMEEAYKKKFSYHLLKFLRLNADRVENIFIISFIVALFLLIPHLLSKLPLH